MKKSIVLFYALVLLASVKLRAQQDISLYALNNVFQQLYINPAFLPDSKTNVGLPVLSSFFVNASNTGFTFGRLVGTQEGGQVDIDRVIDGLGKKNMLALDLSTDLFSLGIKYHRTYFSLSLSERLHTDFTYPKDFFTFIFKGNADDELLGRRASFDGLGYNLSLYHEAALGVSLPIGEKIRAGVRVKYLLGLVNLTTERSKLGITTDPNNFELTLDGSLAFNTSGFGILRQEGDDISQTFQERILYPAGNKGLAFDFGAEYFINDRLSVTGSLLNLGSIKWSQDVKNYSNDNIYYRFEALDLNKVSQQDLGSQLGERIDSLNSKLQFTENSNAYSARLNPQLIGGANLRLTSFNTVGAIMRAELVSKVLRPSFSAYYQFKINHWFGATVNYSYLNRSLLNIGGGVSVKLLPFQFYLCSDNILAPLALTAVKTAQIRFGMNLAFGGKDVKKLRIPEVDRSLLRK